MPRNTKKELFQVSLVFEGTDIDKLAQSTELDNVYVFASSATEAKKKALSRIRATNAKLVKDSLK